ncbi:MAG: anti-sigma-factor antagonist [Segetibacter sp.]|nr:anti-sigma-factor antagonist [Segetibacter sp.]
MAFKKGHLFISIFVSRLRRGKDLLSGIFWGHPYSFTSASVVSLTSTASFHGTFKVVILVIKSLLPPAFRIENRGEINNYLYFYLVYIYRVLYVLKYPYIIIMKFEIAKSLQKKKKQILEAWVQNQLKDESLREDLMSNDELRKESEELLDSLLQSINNKNISDTDSAEFDSLNEIISGISITRARQGFSPKETGSYIFSLREALIETLHKDFKGDPIELLSSTIQIVKLVDNLAVVTFETFIKGREEVILRQTNEITEISTPVIRVWDGILALPIIGTLDSSRTQVVMENLLVEIVESGSSIAILDISGVPAVDSLVAQHLIKTVSATRLMGAECIISGIRPEIAQTVVHLGIDLSNIVTKATLASALRYAFTLLKLEVKKTTKSEL